jgi:hypothetical protein
MSNSITKDKEMGVEKTQIVIPFFGGIDDGYSPLPFLLNFSLT